MGNEVNKLYTKLFKYACCNFFFFFKEKKKKERHYQVGNILKASCLLPITINSQWLLP